MTTLTSSEQGNGGPRSDDGSSIRTRHLKNHAPHRDYDTKSLTPERGRIRRLSDSETVYENWTGEVWLDQCSSTRSLWARDLDYREINGRRYCRNYHMPNDETEQLRLTIQHQVIMHVFEDELTLAPIHNPTHVLDLGTGTGEWAIRFAELHPYCEVVGTDISAIQETRRVPANVFFEVEDAEEWDRPTEHYDLVHVRGLEGAFRDWPAVYKNIYDSLKPGGWVQVADMGGKEGSYSFFSGFPPEAPIFRIMKHLFDAAEKDGRPRGMHHLNPEYLAKAGFVDIHVTDKTLPMAIDEDSIGKLWLMAWLDGLEAYALRTLTEVVGWDPDDAMRDLRQTARELARRARNKDYCKTMTLTMRVVLARKPLAPVTMPWSNSSLETSPVLAALRSVNMGQYPQQ
ncbi:hypothetical protein E4U60_003056 [Claviceps pazoutovae]|uniref:S-adenosyl-L-methionine-dependent methyltransferase n=1 Tax=Claviceps pazoutovae TaxID=1649127 RepID=A0A9P7SKV4_9HYPO|nr:hypothetical protein E4U60_003056 [Claviceps pazoutovae]